MAGSLNSGRRPKPTALHKLQGTRAQSRALKKKPGREPQPQGDLVDPPDYLTPSQREGWEYAIRHAPKGLLKMLDRNALVAFVVAEDRLRAAVIAQTTLDEQSALPLLIRGKNGLTISPYVEISDRAIKSMLQASDRLGFSPVARPRIQIEPPPAAETPATAGGDAWSRLRRFPVIDGGKAS